MAYAEFNPVVKKMNLKPKGEIEIVLTTSLSELRGSMETLSDMIDQKVRIQLDSTVVTYNVQINARTDKPIINYNVDAHGHVSEVKPAGEQMEMELNGAPKAKEPVKDVPAEIDRTIVDEFILSGLAPRFQELGHWPVIDWIELLSEGETYMRLASEYGLSSGRIVELVDQYRKLVAPLAAKWDEWRQVNADAAAEPDDDNDEESADEDSEGEDFDGQEDGAASEQTDDDAPPPAAEEEDTPAGDDQDDTLPEWLKGAAQYEVQDEDGEEADQGDDTAEPLETENLAAEPVEQEIDLKQIEEYILDNAPIYPEIPLDMAALVYEKKQKNLTWVEMSAIHKMPSTKLQSIYADYKKLVKKDIRKGNGAA